MGFNEQFNGNFTSALRWHHLDALWDTLRANAAAGWYLYAVGQDLPAAPATAAQVTAFIDEVDALLRKDHDEDYCGIVYADDLGNPSMVKIYDPNNLGAVCGSSGSVTLPGWVMSLAAPTELKTDTIVTGSRRRWWQRMFG